MNDTWSYTTTFCMTNFGQEIMMNRLIFSEPLPYEKLDTITITIVLEDGVIQ